MDQIAIPGLIAVNHLGIQFKQYLSNLGLSDQ